MTILSYDQMQIIVSALVMYRDSQMNAANTLWSGTAMAVSCQNDAVKAIDLIDEFNNAQYVEANNSSDVDEIPMQYWALYLEGIDGSKRVIAPFFTQKEADDYALRMASKGEMNNLVWYSICTENPCEHGSSLPEESESIQRNY